eukprot:jgi/Chrzof1/8935/Cz03g29210.t1
MLFGLAAAEGPKSASPVRKLLQRGRGGRNYYDRGNNYNSERQGLANQLSIDATSRNVAAAAEYSSDPYVVRAVTESGINNAQAANCYASGGTSPICYGFGRRRILRGVTAV